MSISPLSMASTSAMRLLPYDCAWRGALPRVSAGAFPRTSPLVPRRRALHKLPRRLPSPSIGSAATGGGGGGGEDSVGSRSGCYPLFSRQTLEERLWNRGWQRLLLDRLNDEVRGTDLEHATIVDTVIATSQDPHRIQTFNLASQALNNAFFLSSLRPKALGPNAPPAPASLGNDEAWRSTPPPRPSRAFEAKLSESFESLPAFKSAFSSAAYGMSGSGWVWLVLDGQRNLGVVPTFGAGTVLVQNRLQRGMDVAELEASVNELETDDGAASLQGAVGAETEDPMQAAAAASSPPPPGGGAGGRNSNVPSSSFSSAFGRAYDGDVSRPIELTGAQLYPLFCLSVHEHAWLGDLGMRRHDGSSGKEEYLLRFWECLDWAKVEERWRQHGGGDSRAAMGLFG